MEDEPAAKRRRDRVANLGQSLSEMANQNREGAQRYEEAGLIGRFLIRHREPEVFEQYQKLQKVRTITAAIASREEARRAADAIAATTWVF